MSEFMENHINDLELQIAQLETAVRCYVVDIDIQKQKNKELQQIIDKAIEYIEKNKHLNWYVESCYISDLLKLLKGEE